MSPKWILITTRRPSRYEHAMRMSFLCMSLVLNDGLFLFKSRQWCYCATACCCLCVVLPVAACVWCYCLLLPVCGATACRCLCVVLLSVAACVSCYCLLLPVCCATACCCLCSGPSSIPMKVHPDTTRQAYWCVPFGACQLPFMIYMFHMCFIQG